jgi:hypothetical protein
MLFVGETAPDRNRGRPAAQYKMPDIRRLCAAYNVAFAGGDALETDDLRSVKKYRQGVHRELIKRRPGLYARDWLANRLGVTVRSMQRYRQDAKIEVKSVYREVPITWHTLNYIPAGVPTAGVFLEDEAGKRYPPLPVIARKLLRQKKKLRCLFQCENHYSVKDSFKSSVVSSQAKAENQENTDAARQSVRSAPINSLHSLAALIRPNRMDAVQNSVVRPGGSAGEVGKTLITTKNSIVLPIQLIISSRYITKSKRYYRQPLPIPAHEDAATHLYRTLKSLCREKAGYISLPAARKLVEQYGGERVGQAVRTAKSRRNLATPAGFIISWLRSDTKAWQNQPLEIRGIR